MIEGKVTLTDNVAIVPIEDYLKLWRTVQSLDEFTSAIEGEGDFEFRSNVALEAIFLITRTFPLP